MIFVTIKVAVKLNDTFQAEMMIGAGMVVNDIRTIRVSPLLSFRTPHIVVHTSFLFVMRCLLGTSERP